MSTNCGTWIGRFCCLPFLSRCRVFGLSRWSEMRSSLLLLLLLLLLQECVKVQQHVHPLKPIPVRPATQQQKQLRCVIIVCSFVVRILPLIGHNVILLASVNNWSLKSICINSRWLQRCHIVSVRAIVQLTMIGLTYEISFPSHPSPSCCIVIVYS